MNYLEKYSLILLILLVRKKLIGMCIPDTPCPSIFLYKYHKNIWYGELKILVPDPNAINVQLDVAYYSRIRIQSSIENSLNTLHTAEEFATNIENFRPVTFILSFPFPNDPPRISDIILNGNTICTGPFDEEAVVKAKVQRNVEVKKRIETIRVGLNGKPVTNKPFHQQQEQQQQQLQQQKQQHQQQNEISENRVFIPTDSTNICGTESVSLKPLHLIVNGVDDKKQPWLVALFDNDAKQPTFFCAASLISSRFVVTAAHCTIQKMYVLIKLGGRDVSTISDPEGVIRVSDLIVNHPNYRSQSSDADVAVIKMSEPVTFNNNIKPVCLWPNVYLEEEWIIGRRATIFGWGNDANGRLSLNAPKKTNLVIKSYDECKKMSLLDNVISDKTICATGANAYSGPCLGDSGGGLYIQVNNKWTIRGVISAAIGKEISRTCDVENYFSVYTDTGKYFDWIDNIVRTV